MEINYKEIKDSIRKAGILYYLRCKLFCFLGRDNTNLVVNTFINELSESLNSILEINSVTSINELVSINKIKFKNSSCTVELMNMEDEFYLGKFLEEESVIIVNTCKDQCIEETVMHEILHFIFYNTKTLKYIMKTCGDYAIEELICDCMTSLLLERIIVVK